MSRFRFFSASIALLGLIACGQSTDVNLASAQDTVSEASLAPSWTVIAEKSHLKFTAEQEGKPFMGEFPAFDAVINFDPNNLEASSVKVTVPLAQVDAKTKDRNATLPGKVWFSTKKFPEAVFESADITKTGEGSYLAKGSLNLKGQSNPLELPFTLIISDQALMNSTVVLDRTIWNVGEDPWNTNEWVSREVTLDIQVAATR